MTDSTTAKVARLHVFLELSALAIALHLGYLSLFRRYPEPLQFLGESFLVGVLALFTIVWLRSRPGRDDFPRSPWARLRPGRWLSAVRNPELILLGCFLFVFYLLQVHGGRVGNDGTMFFVNVRSLVMDGDFDLTNEFRDFVPQKFHVPQVMGAGDKPQPGNELGVSFLWMPFFAIAHILVTLGRVFGSTIPADGYSYPYINAVCLGSLLLAFVGVVLSYRLARRYFDPMLAACSAVVLWLASPLIWYTMQEPAMSHAVSTMAVALLLTIWLWARSSTSLARWSAVALAAGLVISVQRYNVFYLIAPALTLVGRLRDQFSAKSRSEWVSVTKKGALVMGVLAVASAPLWIYNLYMQGVLIGAGDWPSNSITHWRRPHVWAFLFSSNHGLFSWTPVAYLSAIGLVMFLRRDRTLAGTLLVTLLGGIYLLSSNWNWWAGYSFGSRRMTEAYPLFLMGLCAFIDWVRRSPQTLIAIGATGIVLWNFLLVEQLRRGELPPMETFSFSEAVARGTEDAYQSFGHPPAVPANWVFAWRYGVRPDQFDWIVGGREYHNLALDVGSQDDRKFIGAGWSAPERMPDGRSYRWSDGAESSILLYLFFPYRYRLRVVGEPIGLAEPYPQNVAVTVNGKRASVLTFNGERHESEILIPRDLWKSGLNEIRFRYSTTARADEVYGGSDASELGLRVESIELRIDEVVTPD